MDNASDFTKRLLYLGSEFEKAALLEFQNVFRLLNLGGNGYVPGMSPHVNNSWLTGTPDYILDHVDGFKAVIEVKTHWHPNASEARPISEVERVPLKHWLQVQTYLEIQDLPVGYLWSWTMKNGNTCFRINRDRGFFDGVILPQIMKFRRAYEFGTCSNDDIDLRSVLSQMTFMRGERKQLMDLVYEAMLCSSQLIIRNNNFKVSYC